MGPTEVPLNKRHRPLALFINPPIYDFALFDLYLKPYGLLRLADWLSEAGYDVELLDYLDHTDPETQAVLGTPRRKSDGTGKLFRDIRVERPKTLARVPRRYARYGVLRQSAERRLAALRPDVVLLSTTMTYWYPGLVEATQTARRLFGNTPVVVGGPYVCLCLRHARANVEADHHVVGEAWPILAEILSSLRLPTPLGPPPDRLLLHAPSLAESAPLRLNRGCPMRCDYCASPLLCPGFAAGRGEEAYRSMAAIIDALGTRRFAFYDDALLAAKEQAIKPFLRRAIAGRESAGSGRIGPWGISFATPNALHISLLDEETAALMARAGFTEIRLGYESSSAQFHASHDMKVAPGMLSRAVRMLRSAGFRGRQITAYVLAGLPGQRKDEILESVESVRKEGIRVSVAEFSPVAGTPLWERCLRESRYPLAEEPLFHNNSVVPMEWEGFTRDDLAEVKRAAREVSRTAS
jgi:radical SAM superfamily enzyme YgiQ (UPF0313 family)